MSFHASYMYSYRRCPVCVPCVSRLPPVSFYRYRFKDTGGAGTHTQAHGHTDEPHNQPNPPPHPSDRETTESAAEYRSGSPRCLFTGTGTRVSHRRARTQHILPE